MDQPMMNQGQPPMNQGQPMMSPHPSDPSQQPMMQQQSGNPSTTIMMMPMGPQSFGPDPQRMICPYCQADQTTYVIYQMGLLTWIVAFCLLPICLWCVPFCCGDPCKDAEHHCSSCQRVVGPSKRC